jgi:cell shape-determining protein MreD
MTWARAGIFGAFLFVIFIIQEAAVSKINFPISGFSLYLAVLLGLMSLEDKFGAIVLGFIGGLILDFSPASDSPFGKWALILTLIGYVFATNRESVGDFTQRPGAFVIFVSVGSALTVVIFLCVGLLLGENNGALGHNVLTILGNGIWTLLFAPILLPGLVKWRKISVSSRDRV